MNVLMVCLGNICRSPMADGLLRTKVANEGLKVFVDSAGTSGFHSGQAPDPRMRKTAAGFGVDIDGLRARKFTVKDYDEFDLIYVMDSSNYRDVIKLARNETDKQKVKLILNELHPDLNQAVPDPYYGGEQGFIDVFNLLDRATDKIMEKLIINEKG